MLPVNPEHLALPISSSVKWDYEESVSYNLLWIINVNLLESSLVQSQNLIDIN